MERFEFMADEEATGIIGKDRLVASLKRVLEVSDTPIPYTERGSHCVHVRPWHHFARILQTKAEPGPSHSGSGRHNRAVGLARIHLPRRSTRPTRLGHSRNHR